MTEAIFDDTVVEEDDDLFDEDIDEFDESDDDDWEDQAELIGLLGGPFSKVDPIGGAIRGALSPRKRPRTPIRRPGKQPFYRTPPASRPVTQTQLRSSLAKVQADFNRTTAAVKRVDASSKRNAKAIRAQSVVNSRQGRQIRKVDKKVDAQAQNQLLMTLLQGTEEFEIKNVTGAGIPADVVNQLKGVKVEAERKTDTFNLLLPMLLGGGGLGMGGNNGLLLALALSDR